MFLDWVENLPDRWKAKPLRSLASYAVSNVNKSVLCDEIPVRLCNYTDVYHNEFIALGLDFMRATASEHEIEKFGLSVGDIIITKDSETWDDIGVPALVRETADDLVCGYHLAILRPDGEIIDGAFLFRCLQAKPVRLQLELSAKGVTRFGLPKSEIGAMTLPVPPLSRQRAIADYLDRETARLDALVAAKERLLVLLAEKRQALIDDAVTGRINLEFFVHDSEIVTDSKESDPTTGRGKVSAAVWTAQRKLKYLAGINNDSLGEDTDPDLDIRYIDIGSVDSSGNIGRVSTFAFGDAPSRARRCVRDGDVIVSTVRTYLQAIAQVRNPPENTVASTGFAVIRPRRDFNVKYCKYALRESSFLAAIEGCSVGVNYPAINATDLAGVRVYTHSPALQRAIAAYLDRETRLLDELAAKTRDTIALLKERRIAVIVAAVTGQIDVEHAS